MTVTRERLAANDGTPIEEWTLDDGTIRLSVLSLGGVIRTLEVPDRDGTRADVVLGFDDPARYAGVNPYLGALIGRYANRIAEGRFTLDGTPYTVDGVVDGAVLHGGPDAFHLRHWRIEPLDGAGLRLHLHSPDGDQGFPGALDVTVDYLLVPGGPGEHRLRIVSRAVTDAPTVVNLTQHSYLNLAGALPADGGEDVTDHTLQVLADHYLPVGATKIPTGEVAPVEGPFDLRRPGRIGDALARRHAQTDASGGLDHTFVLDGYDPTGTGVRTVAVLEHAGSGRRLEVATSEPGLQVYTANDMLDGALVGKGGRVYRPRDGVCLETQHFPDAPNRPAFATTTLRPGQTFTSTTEWRFSTTPRTG